jgi:hypothetical protein
MNGRLGNTFSSNSTSIRSKIPLENAQIARVAPSIFAQEPHESRSERFSFISTISVLDECRREGFQPFFACQSKSRIPGKSEFTKHMIRLRHASDISAAEAREIVLINGHDGTASFKLLAGMFRFVCQNGLITADLQNEIRIHHKGDVKGQVIDAAYTVLDSFEAIEESTKEMKALTLSRPEQEVFAEAALSLKYDTSDGNAPILPTQLLSRRRYEDADSSIWGTYNTVQENTIRGGLPGRTASNRKTRTREVQGIDQNVKLNSALWILAERMKELKAA